MRLSMTHHFPCTPEELWSVFDDPTFNQRMSQRTGVVRELLEQRNDERGSYVKWKVIALVGDRKSTRLNSSHT